MLTTLFTGSGYGAVAALMVAAGFAAMAEAQSALPKLPLAIQEAPTASSAVSSGRQSLDDARFTGPMLAVSAATLPRGHFLIEPYFYDVAAAHVNALGSRAYVLYGIADGLTVGLIPIVGFNVIGDGLSSSGVGLGDVTLMAQRRLTRYHEGRWTPAISVMVQQALPTGKYDRLGDRPSDGFGSGAYTTTLGLNSQTYFWLPNGRILRLRFDLSQALSNHVNVDGVSVYGTSAEFRGTAKPGSSFSADVAWEYSMTRRWVWALDVTYGRTRSTRVTGHSIRDQNGAQGAPSVLLDSGSSEAFGFAPAIEYSWTPNLGVLLGVRVIPSGRNTTATIAPVLAINFVR
jgi:hypothetical protein